LITEADQELRDIVGQGSNLIYHFIGEGDEFDEARLSRIILGGGVPLDKLESVVEYLLYYGFVGVKIPGVGIKYIFDVGYDMKLFKVVVAKQINSLTYVLNPAFTPGLNF
jgi:hypothetical protein